MNGTRTQNLYRGGTMAMQKKKRKKRNLNKPNEKKNFLKRIFQSGEAKPLPDTELISTGNFYLLKWIAFICMVMDHIAAMFYDYYVWNDDCYIAFRLIGRIAFPIFAYELVESFHHTKHKGKHFLRIGILALVSEIPFDIALGSTPFTLQAQNVCITLFLGFLMLWITNINWSKWYYERGMKTKWFNHYITGCTVVTITAVFALIARFFRSDYSWKGIVLIMMLDFARRRKYKKVWQVIAFMPFLLIQYTDVIWIGIALSLAFILTVEFDRKERNNVMARALKSNFSRAICRICYPLHLTVLIVIKLILV